MTTNYANKRVEIKSKEHLDYVIEVTGIDIEQRHIDTILCVIDSYPVIVFEGDFNDNNRDWYYDYAGEHEVYDDLTLESEEIFIDLPSKSDPNLDDLWYEFLKHEGISFLISSYLPKDLAKNFAKFTLNKMKN